MVRVKVVSGGQTGVDRAALDAAVRLGIRYGGWCPAGGWAEDFQTPPGLLDRYPELRETPLRDPAQRTEWNVRDSDATLLLWPAGADSPGTRLTESVAVRLGRPLARLDPFDSGAAPAVVAFIEDTCANGRLNVAGPRESGAPGVHEAALHLLARTLGRA